MWACCHNYCNQAHVMIKSTLWFDDVEVITDLLPLLRAVQRSRMRLREWSRRQPGNEASLIVLKDLFVLFWEWVCARVYIKSAEVDHAREEEHVHLVCVDSEGRIHSLELCQKIECPVTPEAIWCAKYNHVWTLYPGYNPPWQLLLMLTSSASRLRYM